MDGLESRRGERAAMARQHWVVDADPEEQVQDALVDMQRPERERVTSAEFDEFEASKRALRRQSGPVRIRQALERERERGCWHARPPHACFPHSRIEL